MVEAKRLERAIDDSVAWELLVTLDPLGLGEMPRGVQGMKLEGLGQ